MERDVTSLVEEERTKLKFTVEKGRGGGVKTGFIGFAQFDTGTLTLKDVETNNGKLPNT